MKRTMGKFVLHQPLRKAFFLFYVMALFYVTLLAWNYGASLGPEGPGGRNYNITPFRSIYRISVFSKDVMDPIRILIGNIILFIPLGFMLRYTVKKFSRTILGVVLIGMFVSVFIELNQFAFTFRVANIDDVILNTFGTFIGAILYSAGSIVKKRVIFFDKK